MNSQDIKIPIDGYLRIINVGNFRAISGLVRHGSNIFITDGYGQMVPVEILKGVIPYLHKKWVELRLRETAGFLISDEDAERYGIAKIVDGKVVALPEKKPAREVTVDCLLNPPTGGPRAELCRLYNARFVVDGNDVFVDCLKLKRSAREPAGLLIFVRSDGAEYVIAESEADR